MNPQEDRSLVPVTRETLSIASGGLPANCIRFLRETVNPRLKGYTLLNGIGGWNGEFEETTLLQKPRAD